MCDRKRNRGPVRSLGYEWTATVSRESVDSNVGALSRKRNRGPVRSTEFKVGAQAPNGVVEYLYGKKEENNSFYRTRNPYFSRWRLLPV